MEELVTIQIPTFNQALFIEKAIKSAMEQTYKNKEIIILDDNSIDNTYSIAKSYENDYVKVYKNEENIGRVKTYNKLLYLYSRGKWIVNLDGDDFFTDINFIKNGVDQLMKNQNAMFYQATIKSSNSNYEFKHKLINNGSNILILNGLDYFKNFKKNSFFSHLATIYNKNIAIETGFYNFDCLQIDAESILKLALKGDVILHNTIVGTWNIHENNESNNFSKEYEKNILSIKRLGEIYKNYTDEKSSKKWIEDNISYCRFFYLDELIKVNFYTFVKEVIINSYYKMELLIIFKNYIRHEFFSKNKN